MTLPNATLTPADVLKKELETIELRRQSVVPGYQPAGPTANPTGDAHRVSSFGVSFSGGGIRSATFNLGVLQGLAERGLLPRIDMLSTVSGGGYIGSWLHGLMREHDGGDPSKTQRRLVNLLNDPPGPPDKDPIMFLRAYSNYLAPRPGLFSADTWTMVVIWVRNVLLNQLILAPALATLAAFAVLATCVKQAVANAQSAYWAAASLAMVALIAATILLRRNLLPIARDSHQAADVLNNSAAAKRPEASGEGLLIVLLVFISAVMLGTMDVVPGQEAYKGAAVVAFGLMLVLQLGGGFIGCFKARHHWDWLAYIHAVWMPLAGAAVAAACSVGVWKLTAGWQSQPWNVVIFGPSLMILSVIVSIMLLIGLMGADYPDAAREWTARTGSRLAIAAAAWTVLAWLCVIGPWAVSSLIARFQTIGLGAVLAWLATAGSGVLAGSSGKTDGKRSTGTKRVLELLTDVAPTIFLVGYMIAIAAGVHLLLDRFVPHALRPAIAAAATTYDVDVQTPDAAKVAVRVERSEQGWLASRLEPVDRFRRGYPDRLTETPDRQRVTALSLIAAGLLALSLIASSRININEFSLHHFYKNRLVRCYLGASNSRRRPNTLTGFDPHDDFPLAFLTPDATTPAQKPKAPYLGPYPIINTALNLNTGAELAQQERKAASFVFTPCISGFDPSSREQIYDAAGMSPNGYRPTWGYADPHGVNLGTAFAISGAAANPNWGYHTSGPVAFLLTVFNARLGWWLGNPRWERPSRRSGPTLALRYLFAELLGQTTKRTKFINLSDGGHFENLGLYELVRRRARYIIVCDAEEDGDLTFGSLGGVVRKCRADFGVEIDIDPSPISRAGRFSGAHCVVGTITYPEPETAFAAGLTAGLEPLPSGAAVPKARGWLLYVKSSLTGDEPADVIEYQSSHEEFPHESTGDQFFSESQFESYRRLGLHVLRSAFDGVDTDLSAPASTLEKQYPLVGIFQALARRWYAPIPVTAEAATRLADAYVQTMRRLAADPKLASLHAELVLGQQATTKTLTPDLLAFGMELFQLMQNVFTEFKLEGAYNQANPRNGGWIQVFAKWLKSDLLYNHVWTSLRKDYHAIFGQFIDRLHRYGVPDVPPRN